MVEGVLVRLEWLGANGPVGEEDCGSDDVYSDMPVGPTTYLSEQAMRSDLHRPPNRAYGKAEELRRHPRASVSRANPCFLAFCQYPPGCS